MQQSCTEVLACDIDVSCVVTQRSSVVDQSFDRSEHDKTKRIAQDLKSALTGVYIHSCRHSITALFCYNFVVRTRELEASVLAREEFQRQAWWVVLPLLLWQCAVSHLSFAYQRRHFQALASSKHRV